jgi:hypothetical protein
MLWFYIDRNCGCLILSRDVVFFRFISMSLWVDQYHGGLLLMETVTVIGDSEAEAGSSKEP